jgi:hypothetical protein
MKVPAAAAPPLAHDRIGAHAEASIFNKLKRGTFAATFFPAYLAALELTGVALEKFNRASDAAG